MWEFKRNPKVTRISPTKFEREIALSFSLPNALVFQLKLDFRPYEDPNNDEDIPRINDPPNVSNVDLVNVLKRLH